MNEELVFQQILNLHEVIVTNVEISETRIDIHCCNVFEESLCPSCLQKQRQVNQSYTREVRDLPISGKKVFLQITERQFHCPDCDRYFTEQFSFVEKNGHYTSRYCKHLYLQIKQSSIQQVIVLEDICWKTANKIFNRIAHKKDSSTERFKRVRYIGIDEFAIKKGHKDFATVIVDLERLCVIDVLEYRDMNRLISYFESKGKQWCDGIEVFCSDMWDGFVSTGKKVFVNAEIVIDRFHFFKQMNKAVDNQRKALRKELKEEDGLKYIRWTLLKNGEDLSDQEKEKLELAFKIAPELKELYQAKEDLRGIFEQDIEIKQAEKLITQWTNKSEALDNKYLNRFLKTLGNWKSYVLNYFRTRLTTSIVEGVNNKIKMIKRMGFGFRNFTNFRYRILAAFD